MAAPQAQVQVQAQADDWENPNDACFKQGDDNFSRFYFEALVPKRDFIVGGKDDYPEVRHVKYPYKKLLVYTPFARVRYAATGMGNSALNPESKKKTGKAAKMVVSINDSAKCKLSIQQTRWSFDDRLKDAQGRNPDFMRYLEWRREVQRWLAWWIWNMNKAPEYIAEVKKAICTEERTAMVAEANGVKKHLEKEHKDGKMTKEHYEEEKQRVQTELAEQLAKIKESAISPETGIEKFQQMKMHVTYVFKLDSVKSDESADKKQRLEDGSAAAAGGEDDENTAVGKKPDTEHVQFERKAFRWPWKTEFKQTPYVPPSEECATVFNATTKPNKPGLVYDPPVFIEAATMGRTDEELARLEAIKTADEKHADAVTAFNRQIPDDAVCAVGYSMSVYFKMPATGKAGIKDNWEQTIWLRPPTKEDLARKAAWGSGGAGATMAGVNLQKMKKIAGSQPYVPDKDWGKEVQNASADELKMLEEAMIAERERREREAAEKNKKKDKSSSASSSEVKDAPAAAAPAEKDVEMPPAVPLPAAAAVFQQAKSVLIAAAAPVAPAKSKQPEASPAKKGGRKRNHEESS